ncbi:hypothetical protein [Falsiroseomonas sp. HW251]|uniref:hypothetical protein n=1 Tax=Falsiroseomonas sp. HW251 TaxID=3390998 RepID=UPI003D31868B
MAEPEDAPRFIELSPEGLRRRFILAVPPARLQHHRERRLAEMRLGPQSPSEAADPRLAAIRRRLEAAAGEEARQRAGAEAMEALIRRLGLQPAGPPRLDPLPTPAGGDLVLHAEVEAFALPDPPDPAALRIAPVLPAPDPGAVERALLALAESRAEWATLPEAEPAVPGDALLCDVDALLPPPANRLPGPGPAGAAPGALPEGWSFGNNNSGLAGEVVAVAPDAAPPHLALRLHGQASAAGQAFVMLHPPEAVAAEPGQTWAGSVALRLAGPAIGLRGCKLRLSTKPRRGKQTLERKDAALQPGPAFQRAYVSDTPGDPATGFVRLAVLLDHAAGPVDATIEIAAPRLTEGLDLGQDVPLPLPELSGRGLRLGPGGSDPAGLLGHLAGLAAGATRSLALPLPPTTADAALAGRVAQFEVRVAAVLRRRVPPLDDALARALGFDGLDALRASVARRIAARDDAQARIALRRAALDALLAAAPPIAVPEAALRDELAAIWPRLAAEAEARGAPPPGQAAAHALAARRVRLGLLVRALAAKHAIAPDEEALRAAAEAMPGAKPEALHAQALEDLVVAFVLDRATVAGDAAAPR